jgi:ergothioneine biosynthesis protein EgtB
VAPHDPRYSYLFNSYYEAVGDRHPRPLRGMITRPSLTEVVAYRHAVDAQIDALLADVLELTEATDARNASDAGDTGDAHAFAHATAEIVRRIELGLAHEEQHQELILTDLLHAFAQNPLRPAYRHAPLAPAKAPANDAPRVADDGGTHAAGAASSVPPPAPPFVRGSGGLLTFGHEGDGFAFDNERPRHRAYVAPFELGARLVTAGEWIDFIEDGGYETPSLWLSDGWAAVRREGWAAPLYWEHRDGEYWAFSLRGMAPVDRARPVSHVSYYEADAFARWASARLPTELEWEAMASEVARSRGLAGNFVEDGRLVPLDAPARPTSLPDQLFGDVWEWTMSPYVGYPGYRPAEGALGEYNGKFMVNQLVLRGGSCLTPQSHMRATYRNFFPPHARWQMSGLRLARDAS